MTLLHQYYTRNHGTREPLSWHYSVLQFYLRLGCEEHDDDALPELPLQYHTEVQPILLQYATDGGIAWQLVTELTKDVRPVPGRPHATHLTIPLPGKGFVATILILL